MNTICLCLAADEQQRRMMVETLAVRNGFALTRADARKIIRPDTDERVLAENPFFVMSATIHPRCSLKVYAYLYQIALSGRFVAIGAVRMPRDLDFMFTVFTPGDFSDSPAPPPSFR